ncbi:carbohydrate ABC transporter permease [Paenibacillus senegalensis]|uniref:carbohydrate ABC transporter permease n=1 Tax=Paenibacillus senegalensis TaxID=1465766 RepID=UPI000289FF7D|nr:carbohydrate ABC transporter permease [Paenibacillus senegalensis]
MAVKGSQRFFMQVAMWVMVLFFVFPLLWLFLTSFKNRVDAFSIPPKFIFTPTMNNYGQVLQNSDFLANYANSLQVALLTIVFSLLLGIPAAYALARFNMKGKDDTAFWILTTRMAPPIMVVLPFYLTYSQLNLLDTTSGLVIVYMLINLAFVVWMMKGYFESIPEALEEAARIDGTSRLGAMLRVTLPLSAPGIASASIFCFIMSWNEFIFALILSGESTKTVPVAVTSFITFEGIRWGEIAAAGTLIVLPVLIFGIAIQKYLVQGMTMGSVK